MIPPFSVVFEKGALRDMEKLPWEVRRDILTQVQKYLVERPQEPIKTRIKRLLHLKTPLYRLRVGDYRVYYRVKFGEVVILAVLHKRESERWLMTQ